MIVLRYTAQLSTHGDPVLDDLGGPNRISGVLKSRELSQAKAKDEVRETGNTRGLDGFDTPLDPEDIQQKSIHMRRKVGGLMSAGAPDRNDSETSVLQLQGLHSANNLSELPRQFFPRSSR